MTRYALLIGAVVLGWTSLPGAAEAQESEPTRLVVAGGATVLKTTWRGDVGAQSSLEVGLHPYSWLGFYFLGRLGYGAVDQRFLTFISLGTQLGFDLTEGVQLFGRLAFAHQHEETTHVVSEDPFGAVLGIGDGIRHRGGGEASLGTRFAVGEFENLRVFVSVEASAVLFPDDRGPSVYAALSSALGIAYAL